MKSRAMKLQAIVDAGRMGMVEGVLVPPAMAYNILHDTRTVDFALCNMRTLCRLAQNKDLIAN